MNYGESMATTNKHCVTLVMEYPEKAPDISDWVSMKLLKLYRLIDVTKGVSIRDRAQRCGDKSRAWQIIQMYEDTKRISKKTLEYVNKMYRRYNK